MTVSTRRITEYKYEFRSIPNENVSLVFLLSNDDLVCMAAFVDGEAPLPEPREGANGVVHVAYRAGRLADVIDMLRSEKPIYFSWSRDERIARITTHEEPIGESERHGFLSWLFG